MRYLLQSVIVSCVVLTMMSFRPVIGTNRNVPRAGDVLTLHNVGYTDTVSAGDNRLWDLSGIDDAGKMTVRFESFGRDSVSCIAGRTRYFYYISGDTLFNGGFENNLSDMVYNISEAMLVFPFDYGQSVTGEFSGSGLYTDRLRQERGGHYITTADARGTLITPAGDTVPDVVRLVTERYSRNLYLPTGTAGGDGRTDSLLLCEKESRWYAPGHRYPLLMTCDVVSATDSRSVSHTARYVSVRASDVADDPENAAILHRKVAEKATDSDPSTAEPASVVDYTISQDKSAATLTVRYSVSRPTDLLFVLTDIGGIVYRSEQRHCQPGEDAEIVFDYGGLPYSAAYGINISGGQERYSEKFYR